MAVLLAILLSWPFIAGLILLILILEHNDASGWTLAGTIALGTVLYFFLPWLTLPKLGIIAGAWLPIGFGWSFFRWKRHCNDTVESVRKNEIRPDTAKELVNPRQNVTRITHWIIAWPFSFVESIVGDMIDVVHRTIIRIAKSTYSKISDSAIADIDRYDNAA